MFHTLRSPQDTTNKPIQPLRAADDVIRFKLQSTQAVPSPGRCRLRSADILGAFWESPKVWSECFVEQTTLEDVKLTPTHTYQELLSIDKHMILGDVHTVPGQS